MVKVQIELTDEDNEILVKSFKGFTMTKTKALSKLIHEILKKDSDDLHKILCDKYISDDEIKHIEKKILDNPFEYYDE